MSEHLGSLANALPVALLLSAGLVAGAAAQGQPQHPVQVAPIEVVTSRIPESPDNVPAAVEVISGDELRARGATTLRDALSLAAGVAIAPGGDNGPAGSVPEFWGLREFDAFLLVVDGVPWGGALNPALTTLSLRDVERIEVLRGPAPVTYGATSFVGVIHVVHKPAAANRRYAEVHGGSFGSGGGAIDAPLFPGGSWSTRLSADVNRQGFSDDNTSYRRGHALLRTAKLGDNSRTWFTFDVNILRQDPASPATRKGTVLSPLVPLDANYNPEDGFINENRFALSGGFERPVFSSASWSATASYAYSRQQLFRGFLTELSNTPDNASGVRENININDLYADTHIIWPSVSKLQFVTGADLLFAKGEAEGATFDYTVPLDAKSQVHVTEPSTLGLDAEDERLFLGAYGSAEWHPVSRLTLDGGLRLNATSEKRDEGGDEVSHSRLSGSIGALVGLWEQGADHVRAYANYRDTFKPAAVDFGLGEEAGGEEEKVLDPETARSYEGGLKIRAMDGRADIDLSAFHMDFENQVIAAVINNQPTLINAGKTRFQGVEAAADFRLAGDVHVRGTYSFHDGKLVDFVDEGDQLGGNRVEMSARHLASAGVTYAPERGFIGSASVNYTGSRFLNKHNTALAPAFATFDASIGYRFERIELRVDGRNLGDRRDPVAESELGDGSYYRMPARTVRAAVIMSF